MKKSAKLMIAMLLIVLLVVTLVACGKPDTGGTGTPDTKYTISFDCNGGSAVADMVVDGKTEISVPTTTKEGYAFAGWFVDNGTLKTPFDIAYITANPTKTLITVYAKWIKATSPEFFDFVYTDSTNTAYSIIAKENAVLPNEVVLPSSYNGKPVTSIGYSAFSDYIKLTSIIIPSTVTSIGDGAFDNCSGLTAVTIPNSVVSIGYGAFAGTAWLNSQLDGLVYAGKVAYCYKGTMSQNTTITLRDDTKGIAGGAFNGCSGLVSITIPSSVTSIGQLAFYNCSGLTSITIGSGVTSIEQMAFYGCSGLASITIPNSVTNIGEYAFNECSGLTSITIPNSVTSIGNEAFAGTAWLNSQPDGLVYAGKVAYCYKGTMPQNTTITLRDDTKGIAGGAFYSCSGLASITIGSGVTSIGDYAFSGCYGLTSITIPNSVTSIGYGAFNGCSGLTGVTVDKGNTKYKSAGNCLIDATTNTLILGCKDSIIPTDGSVTRIGNEAFFDCSGLAKIDIPNSVTSIGESAFWGCSGLTSITIPNSVISIGDDAFRGCSGLTTATIGSGVTSIGNDTFNSCIKLTSITIGSGVTSIGSNAFYFCSELTSIVIPASVTSIGGSAFWGCSGLTTINCEAASEPSSWYSGWKGNCTANVVWGYTGV